MLFCFRINVNGTDQKKPEPIDKSRWYQVYVRFHSTNLQARVDETLLRNTFLQHGDIADCIVKEHNILSEEGRLSGYAFIYYLTEQGAVDCITSTHQSREGLAVGDVMINCSFPKGSAMRSGGQGRGNIRKEGQYSQSKESSTAQSARSLQEDPADFVPPSFPVPLYHQSLQASNLPPGIQFAYSPNSIPPGSYPAPARYVPTPNQTSPYNSSVGSAPFRQPGQSPMSMSQRPNSRQQSLHQPSYPYTNHPYIPSYSAPQPSQGPYSSSPTNFASASLPPNPGYSPFYANSSAYPTTSGYSPTNIHNNMPSPPTGSVSSGPPNTMHLNTLLPPPPAGFLVSQVSASNSSSPGPHHSPALSLQSPPYPAHLSHHPQHQQSQQYVMYPASNDDVHQQQRRYPPFSAPYQTPYQPHHHHPNN